MKKEERGSRFRYQKSNGDTVGGHASTGFGAKERAGDVCVITWLAGWSWGKDRARTEQAWGLKGQWKN